MIIETRNLKTLFLHSKGANKKGESDERSNRSPRYGCRWNLGSDRKGLIYQLDSWRGRKKVAEITAQAMKNGELICSIFLQARVASLKGLEASIFPKIIEQRTLSTGS